MLSMGMTIGFDDFRRIWRERARVLPGVALQYTLMPGLGWTLATLFELPTPFAVGLILVSCCPRRHGFQRHRFSGAGRRRVVRSDDGRLDRCGRADDTDLDRDPGRKPGRRPSGGIAARYGPGRPGADHARRSPSMAISGRKPSDSPVAPFVAVIAITLIAASVIGSGREQVLEAGPRVLAAVLCLHIGGFLLGYLAGRVFLRRELASRTVSIEVGMQNSGLGVVLAQQNFVSPLVAIPCAISAVFHSLVGSLVAAYWRRSH